MHAVPMRAVRLFTVVIALLALGAVVASSAFAEELNVLINGVTAKAGDKIEGKGGAGTLVSLAVGGSLAITCTAVSVSSTFTAPAAPAAGLEGTYDLIFTGCTDSLGGKCTSTSPDKGAVAGEIVTLGTFKLVYDKISPLAGAILLTIPPTLVVKCTLGVEVKGTILILAINAKEGTKEVIELVTKQTKGDPEDKEYWFTETGTKLTPSLLTSLAGGTFESSGDTATVILNKANGAAANLNAMF